MVSEAPVLDASLRWLAGQELLQVEVDFVVLAQGLESLQLWLRQEVAVPFQQYGGVFVNQLLQILRFCAHRSPAVLALSLHAWRKHQGAVSRQTVDKVIEA